jgi:hypothetical protein
MKCQLVNAVILSVFDSWYCLGNKAWESSVDMFNNIVGPILPNIVLLGSISISRGGMFTQPGYELAICGLCDFTCFQLCVGEF